MQMEYLCQKQDPPRDAHLSDIFGAVAEQRNVTDGWQPIGVAYHVDRADVTKDTQRHRG